MSTTTRIAIAAQILLLSCFTQWTQAQPVRSRILDDVRVTVEEGMADIEIHFTFPVRYINHFPDKSGDTLQIQVQPIAISSIDRLVIRKRESLRLPRKSGVPLLDVSYEGDLAGGPYLTVRFLEAVNFSVHQDTDFRTLSIHISTKKGNTGMEDSTIMPVPIKEIDVPATKE